MIGVGSVIARTPGPVRLSRQILLAFRAYAGGRGLGFRVRAYRSAAATNKDSHLFPSPIRRPEVAGDARARSAANIGSTCRARLLVPQLGQHRVYDVCWLPRNDREQIREVRRMLCVSDPDWKHV